MIPARKLLHDAFEASLIFKGLFALVEAAGGLALLFLSHEAIPGFVHWVTTAELSEDPTDIVARALLAWADGFSVDAQSFLALYLFSHGAIKLVIVILLARKRLWAYPLGLAVFSGFVVYQMYLYRLTPDVSLIFLTALDIVVIALTFIEYRRLKTAPDQRE
jgi:uncharacterized membrane protein